MQQQLMRWLEGMGLQSSGLISLVIILTLIIVTSLIIHVFLHRFLLGSLKKKNNQSMHWWHKALIDYNLFNRIAFVIQGIIIDVQANLWLIHGSKTLQVIELCVQLWVMFFLLLCFFSILNTLLDVSQNTALGRNLPLRGIFQSLKLAAVILIGILMVSTLIGKSPVILFSGLGAMTAILMLVFKDPILGLVAGIQLSANDMLKVGDWLEMSKYGADGEVIDIGLTTVKVRNWDNTVTSLPTYTLISDSFKNWRGMSESGGRRIKRCFFVDSNSVRFLNEEDEARLSNSPLLKDYLIERHNEIDKYNQQNQVTPGVALEARRMTNLGTFRAYLVSYLRANPYIHKGMTQMVRQLESTSTGIPMEIYAFTNTTAWLDYEKIQSDIFDHVFAIAGEFGLKIFQMPTGHDLQHLVNNIRIHNL